MNKEILIKKYQGSFPPHTDKRWSKAVDKQLKGVPFEKRLVKGTYEGIDIQHVLF